MTTTTPTPSPTFSELREAALQCLRPLRVFAQLEELLAAAVVDDQGLRAAAATRTKLERELLDLRERLANERNTLQGQVAAAQAALQSVNKDLRDAREALTKTNTEFDSLRRRITGVAGG